MKDFFEDLGKRLSETAEAVTAKAGDAIEIQKLKAQIRELARGNAEDLMELGQSIYDRFENGEELEFYVLEQTKVNGVTYILVTDSEYGDAECTILKDTSDAEDKDCVFEFVEDDVEMNAVFKIFEELLEDVDIER